MELAWNLNVIIFIDLHLSVSILKRNLYLQYIFITTVRKCVIYSVYFDLNEFSFTKISKFPTVAFLRYSISNDILSRLFLRSVLSNARVLQYSSHFNSQLRNDIEADFLQVSPTDRTPSICTII